MLNDVLPNGLNLMVVLLIVISLIFVIILSLILHHFLSNKNKLRKILNKYSPYLDEESAEILKEQYIKIYNLYLKLSEANKRNFYHRVVKFRDKIETHLVAEKKIEFLLQKADKNSIKEQKSNYIEISKIFRLLPSKVKQKYYPIVNNLKIKLEHGSLR